MPFQTKPKFISYYIFAISYIRCVCVCVCPFMIVFISIPYSLVEDSNKYWDMVSKSKESKGVNNQAKPGQQYNEFPVSDESNLLTRDDITLHKQNLPPQHYDAYLLFDEDDINFATQVLEKMETEYDLKVIK